jgi:carbonic anhydrase
MIEDDEIAMVGAMYDVNSGKVKYKNYADELIELNGKKNKPLAEKLEQVLQDAKISTNSLKELASQ